MNLFRKKTVDEIMKRAGDDASQHGSLAKHLGVRDLTALGIAAIIGAGIFSTIGNASAQGGPGVILLFLFTAIACGFTAFAYAEFASLVPVSGSAYTYSYVAFGEFIAWIIGWALIMEYGIGNITVAISWSDYLTGLLDSMGIHLPLWMTMDYLTAAKGFSKAGALMLSGRTLESLDAGLRDAYLAWQGAPTIGPLHIVADLPALLIILIITWIVYRGIKESKNAGNAMVIIKLSVVLLVIAVGLFYINTDNWYPFLPNGIPGVLKGVSAVFFAYIGFDAISTTAEECKNPQRDLPKGMFYALVIATVLYILVSLALTGMVHYTQLNNEAFLANAFTQIGMNWMGGIIAFSALIATASVLLVFQIGQPRIWMSMSRDGLLPKKLASVHPKFKTPGFATIITGIIVGIPSLFLDVNLVTDLCSIGTLFAFALVCGGILILQHREKSEGLENQAKFKVPYINGRIMMVILWGILLLIFLINNEAKRYIDTIFSLEGGFSVWHHHIPIWIFWSIALVISGYTFVKKWSAIPILGFLSCSYLLSTLGVLNWLRFIVWMLIGLIIYLVYGYKKSKLNSNT